MKYVIYIDVFFFVNLVMDFIIIRLASLYIKPQTTYIRCFLGSLSGSVLTVVSMIIPFKNMIIQMLVSYIFIAIIIVIVTFSVRNMRDLIRDCLIIYVTTIFMGGLISFIYSYTSLGYMLHSVFNGIFQGVNLLWLLGATTTAYICIEGIIRFIKKINNKKMQVIVRLLIDGKSKELRGLVDTGNSLLEPYTGKPVHIVCKKCVDDMIGDIDLYKINLKYVPFQSIGKERGLLKTIEFEEMQVYRMDTLSGAIGELIYKEGRAIVGLYEGVLSRESEFDMILHRSLNI